jgi:quercetin dioxygenase-like cupin family protein
MKRTEPYATPTEYSEKVVHMDKAPVVDLGSHGTSHLICGGKVMLSFVEMEPNSYADPHRHKDVEQATIMLEGDLDAVVEGKLYSLHKGDVAIFAPDEEHGGYVGPHGAKVLDVFSPPRADLLEKLEQATRR